MQLLFEIPVSKNGNVSKVQLLQGDLSALPAEHAADMLIMSAFPNDYTAMQGSLILALEQKGLNVKQLAEDKETDLRSQLHCWLSKPLPAEQQGQFHFKRILCFEPGLQINEPETVVGNIFRCINTFAFDQHNNVVILPVVATGYQKVPLSKMLPALVDSAVFWLKQGVPLTCVKLVIYREELIEEATAIFKAAKERANERRMNSATPLPNKELAELVEAKPVSFWKKLFSIKDKPIERPAMAKPPAEEPPAGRYDYFISYAHTNGAVIENFVQQIKANNQQLNIFFDKRSIDAGALWIMEISNAIQKADKVLVFLSPDYDKSPVCWDEFQCAKLQEYNLKKKIIQTIYLYDYKEGPMPLIMGIYSYIDCREGDTSKLGDAVKQLLV